MNAEFELDATSQLLRKTVEKSHLPQFMPELHLDAFNDINDAVNDLVVFADGIESLSTRLAAMPRPQLPLAVENALYHKLEYFKRTLAATDLLALPYGAPRQPECPDEDVPNLEFLKTVYPEPYKPELGKRLLRVLIYNKPGEPPIHSKWRAPNAEFMVISHYHMPSLRSWKYFWLYIAADRKYERATRAVELKGLGRILILRLRGLTRDQCPDLAKWELRASESAQTRQGSHHPDDSSSLPPSSPLSPWASEYEYVPAPKRRLSPEPVQTESSSSKKHRVDIEQPIDAAEPVTFEPFQAESSQEYKLDAQQPVNVVEPIHVQQPVTVAQPFNDRQCTPSIQSGGGAKDGPCATVAPVGAGTSVRRDSAVDYAQQVEARQPAASIQSVVHARARSSIPAAAGVPMMRNASVEALVPICSVDKQKKPRKQKQKSSGTASDAIYVSSD